MELTPAQFEKLVLEQLDTLYRVARRLTHRADGAGDLVQETYLRAFGARAGFRLQEHGIRPWLLRIMHNLHYSNSARERRQPLALGDDAQAFAQPQHPPAHHNPEAPGRSNGDDACLCGSLDIEQLDERLLHALDALPNEYQVVLLLWAVEELSYKEIAEVIDVPIGTVMSRLHRARLRLDERLHDYAVSEGVLRREAAEGNGNRHTPAAPVAETRRDTAPARTAARKSSGGRMIRE